MAVVLLLASDKQTGSQSLVYTPTLIQGYLGSYVKQFTSKKIT